MPIPVAGQQKPKKHFRKKKERKQAPGKRKHRPLRPDTEWTVKPWCMNWSRTEWRRKLHPTPNKKKPRGSKKKQLLKWKTLCPKGRLMYKKAFAGRMIVYVKDVMVLTGRKRKAATNQLNRVRKQANKDRKDPVTVGDYCKHTKVPEETLRKAMNFVDGKSDTEEEL